MSATEKPTTTFNKIAKMVTKLANQSFSALPGIKETLTGFTDRHHERSEPQVNGPLRLGAVAAAGAVLIMATNLSPEMKTFFIALGAFSILAATTGGCKVLHASKQKDEQDSVPEQEPAPRGIRATHQQAVQARQDKIHNRPNSRHKTHPRSRMTHYVAA